MKNIKSLLTMKGTLLTILATTTAFSLTGCGQKAQCDVLELHAHRYTNRDGYTRYITSEKFIDNKYQRHDDYIILDESELENLEFANKKDLLKIEDNLDIIDEITNSQKDFIQYEYEQAVSNGKFVMMEKRYTTDPNHKKLTGEKAIGHYVYMAYGIELDEKGNKCLISSGKVDDLSTVKDRYPYIKEEFFEVENREYNEELEKELVRTK